MDFTQQYKERADEIVDLFTATFTDSEGATEGRLIGTLARNLLSNVGDADIYVFSALDEAAVAGSIVFTRLTYPEDERTVFVLAPVAVATSQQGKGVGQKLLHFGLETLRADGVDVVVTYGDINFYAKVGFAQIGEDIAKAPLALQYPEGWLGQSLTARNLDPIKGPSTCVDPLDAPEYW